MPQVYNGKVFSCRSEPINVTTLYEPDPSWRFTDTAGHFHQWHNRKGPADRYHVTEQYFIPTLRYIIEVEATDEYPETGHYACQFCGERVRPGYEHGAYRRFLQGVVEYFIDDERVTQEEFERQLALAREQHVKGAV